MALFETLKPKKHTMDTHPWAKWGKWTWSRTTSLPLKHHGTKTVPKRVHCARTHNIRPKTPMNKAVAHGLHSSKRYQLCSLVGKTAETGQKRWHKLAWVKRQRCPLAADAPKQMKTEAEREPIAGRSSLLTATGTKTEAEPVPIAGRSSLLTATATKTEAEPVPIAGRSSLLTATGTKTEAETVPIGGRNSLLNSHGNENGG